MIYINGRFLTQGQTGVQVFARAMVRSLLDQEVPLKILVPENAELDEFREVSQTLKGARSNVWEQVVLPFFMRKNNGLLLNLCNTAPILYSHNALVIHDAAVFENPKWFSSKFANWYRWLQPKIANKAKRLFTVSHSAASSISKHLKIQNKEIEVLHNGLSPELMQANASLPEELKGKKYILFVGSIDPRKRLGDVIEAFIQINQPNLYLVIAGASNPKVFDQDHKLNEKVDQVIWLESIDKAGLKALYQNARFLVSASEYEGFGLPNLEAMALGCPVVVSDIPAHREVVENAGLYFELGNIEGIKEHIESLLIEEENRKAWIDKGHERSKAFDYDKSARILMKSIEDFI